MELPENNRDRQNARIIYRQSLILRISIILVLHGSMNLFLGTVKELFVKSNCHGQFIIPLKSAGKYYCHTPSDKNASTLFIDCSTNSLSKPTIASRRIALRESALPFFNW